MSLRICDSFLMLFATDLQKVQLPLSCTCTVCYLVADIAGQRVGGGERGGGVCLRISKYERQMGIPSLHTLFLSDSLSAPAPASLHGSLRLWADGARRILGRC